MAGLFVPPTYVPHRVLDKIWSYLDPARRAPEAGGLLLGPRGTDNLILDFIFDEEATTTRVSYTLGTEFLNRALAEAGAVGLDGKGMVHSHPGDATQLSSGDLIYVRKVFTHAPGVEMFLMPVVAGRRIFPWVVSRQAPNHPVLSPFVVI